jgi:hypothetical protein
MENAYQSRKKVYTPSLIQSRVNQSINQEPRPLGAQAARRIVTSEEVLEMMRGGPPGQVFAEVRAMLSAAAPPGTWEWTLDLVAECAAAGIVSVSEVEAAIRRFDRKLNYGEVMAPASYFSVVLRTLIRSRRDPVIPWTPHSLRHDAPWRASSQKEDCA